MQVNAGALFLDRDGVVNVDYGYVHRVEDFSFVDGVFDTARRAVALGFRIIIVTNQAGIGRGLYTEAEFSVLTEWMCSRFQEEGAPILDVYHCPYHADGIDQWRVADHPDRKPNPGMLLRGMQEHGLLAHRSLLLGDHESDTEAGRRAGLFGVAQLTPKVMAQGSDKDRILASHSEVLPWLEQMAHQITSSHMAKGNVVDEGPDLAARISEGTRRHGER